MVGHGESSAGSYLADSTSPIPSHCASIVATSTLRVKYHYLELITFWNSQSLTIFDIFSTPLCFSVIILMIIFSQFLHRINIPCVSYTRKEGCVKTKGYPLFKMFPVSVLYKLLFTPLCCGL